MLTKYYAAATLLLALELGTPAHAAANPRAHAMQGLTSTPVEKLGQFLPSVRVVEGELARRVDGVLQKAASTGFGGAIIVEVDDRVVLKAGYGFADRERKVPYTTSTIHPVGSISKPFTAMAILSLVEAGTVDLQQPAGKYLKAAAQPAASASLHQLLTHTSGMVEYCGSDNDIVTKRDLLTRCMAAKLVHQPGSRWSYSNPGFSVLAAVVEEVSGEALDDYLATRVFKPLGLANTGYRLPGVDRAAFARDYLRGRLMPFTPGQAVDGRHWQVAGNGGLYSNVSDMHRWYRALRGDLTLSPQVRAMMLEGKASRQPNVKSTYGFVRMEDARGDPTYIGHDGSNGSFYASFFWRPKDKTFVYFVGNNGEDEVKQVLRQVRALVTSPATKG